MGGHRRPASRRWPAGVAFTALIIALAWWAPGSPLRTIAARVTGSGPGRDSVSVVPGGRLAIVFERPNGAARIDWTDGPELVVSAPRNAANYTVDTDSIRIVNHRSARFDVRIPRQALHVEICVGDRRLFLKEGASAGEDLPGPINLPFTRDRR